MSILLLILTVLFLITQVFFLIQVTEVGIHVLNPDGFGFWVTANPFAWLLVFLLLCVIATMTRFIFIVVNILVTAVLASVFSAFSPKDTHVWRSTPPTQVVVAYLLLWLTWAVASLYLTNGVMNHFAANPQLNTWLAEGNFLSHVLVYFGILGLVFPQLSKS